MQDLLDLASVAVLLCVLASSLRLVFYRSFEESQGKWIALMTRPEWCLLLVVFIPYTLKGFATDSIPLLPWDAFTAYFANGLLDALAFLLCVTVVHIWLFVAAGRWASLIVDTNDELNEEEKAAERRLYTVTNFLIGVFTVMQSGNVYYILGHLNAITLTFIVVITALGIYFHSRFTASIVLKAPAILTTCGILGTFLGVAIGLMNFDPNAIQNSVPALIDGIKTAFWASACGIFFALTIKLREVFGSVRQTYKSRATIDDLATLMAAVQQSLAGKEESLHSQMTMARQDNNERLDALAKIMDSYVKQRMTEASLATNN